MKLPTQGLRAPQRRAACAARRGEGGESGRRGCRERRGGGGKGGVAGAARAAWRPGGRQEWRGRTPDESRNQARSRAVRSSQLRPRCRPVCCTPMLHNPRRRARSARAAAHKLPRARAGARTGSNCWACTRPAHLLLGQRASDGWHDSRESERRSAACVRMGGRLPTGWARRS